MEKPGKPGFFVINTAVFLSLPVMKICIITEASISKGFGHLTRMMAIYQVFELHGIVPVLIVNGDTSINPLLKNCQAHVFDWIEQPEYLTEIIQGSDIVVIDSYLAGLDLYRAIRQHTKIAVYYDDNNRLAYPPGIVINGNIHAKHLKYPSIEGVEYLLGVEYLPMRKEFWDLPARIIHKELTSIMLTFGGDDFRNLTPVVLSIIKKKFPTLQKNVIIGGGYKNIDQIKKTADQNTNLIYLPDAGLMKKTMLESDIAISAGGQTLYELAATGTPAMSILTADNQSGNVAYCEKAGFTIHLGNWNDQNLSSVLLSNLDSMISYEKRQSMSHMGQNLIDGQGVFRIYRELMKKIQ